MNDEDFEKIKPEQFQHLIRGRGGLIGRARPDAKFQPRRIHPLDAIVGNCVIDLEPLMVNKNWTWNGRSSVKALMRATGFSRNLAWKLLRDAHRTDGLRLDTIARLCEVFQCQPDAFLRYVPRRTDVRPRSARPAAQAVVAAPSLSISDPVTLRDVTPDSGWMIDE